MVEEQKTEKQRRWPCRASVVLPPSSTSSLLSASHPPRSSFLFLAHGHREALNCVAEILRQTDSFNNALGGALNRSPSRRSSSSFSSSSRRVRATSAPAVPPLATGIYDRTPGCRCTRGLNRNGRLGLGLYGSPSGWPDFLPLCLFVSNIPRRGRTSRIQLNKILARLRVSFRTALASLSPSRRTPASRLFALRPLRLRRFHPRGWSLWSEVSY